MSDSGLRYLTNNNELNVDLPKIFCCCHPEDASHLKDVCGDLLAAANCIVFFYPEGEEPEPEAAEEELRHMNLFVPIMTSASIFKDCFVSCHAFKIAEKYSIPVLPIMLESGLEEDFNEKFGNLQCLLRNGNLVDNTTIPYTEKLKNALEGILHTSVDRQSLKDAFDASIFLSYRKKDRASAQELIHIIHEDERCRNIAIWYDEFLLPGEDFNSSIREELEQSTVFVMAVTPHITEENNYIQIVEYPMAIDLGKPVIPCEVQQTQTALVSRYFPGIESTISTLNSEEVRNAILSAIEKTGGRTVRRSSERDLLMGIAYLNGICTEKNAEIAFSLIHSAAEAGEPGAMRELATMYRYGNGTAQDLDAAIDWQKRLIEKIENRPDKPKNAEYDKVLVPELFRLAELQGQRMQTVDKDDLTVYSTYDRVADIAQPLSDTFKTMSAEAIRTAANANELKAKLYMSQGWYSQARAFAMKWAVKCRERVCELENTKKASLELAEAYLRDGKCCIELQYAPGVHETILKTYEIIPDTDIEKEGHYADILLDMDKVPSSEEYAYYVRVLNCCQELIKLYIDQKWWFSAETLINETRRVAEKLVSLIPSEDSKRLLMQIYLSDSVRNPVYESSNDPSFIEDCLKARELAEEIAEQNGLAESRLDLAEIDLRLAGLYNSRKMKEETENSLSAAYAAVKQIAEETPTFRARDLFRQLSEKMSVMNYNAGDKAKAYRQMEISEELAKEVAQTSYNYTKAIDYANSLILHSEMLKKEWDMDGALEYMEKGCDELWKVVQITKRLRELRMYVKALEDLVSLCRLCGEFDKANSEEKHLNSLKSEYSEFFG